MQDLRLALRTIRGTPVIATAAILSLALGIGASTAMFALVNSLTLRVLPVADPERLVTLSTGPAATQAVFTYATYEEIRRQQRFASVSTYAASLLTIENEPRNVLSQWVSGDFFSTLGVRPFKGRTLTTADDVAGGGPDGPAGMISYISPLLYGVRPHDPLTFLGSAALLVVIGVIASALPAIGASRVDPAKTLRL